MYKYMMVHIVSLLHDMYQIVSHLAKYITNNYIIKQIKNGCKKFESYQVMHDSWHLTSTLDNFI